MKKDANIETYKMRGGYKGPLPQGQPGSAVTPDPFRYIPAVVDASVGGKFDKLKKDARTARGGDVPASRRVNKYSRQLGLREIRNAREDGRPPRINPRKAYDS